MEPLQRTNCSPIMHIQLLYNILRPIMALQGCEKNLSSPRCGKKQKTPGRHVYVNPRALKRYRISEVVYNTVPRMVLKTAEGISGIADESPGVNLFVPQKRLLLPSWQAGASQPCRPLACAVTHSLPRALARSPLTLAFLGFL